jgi:hypothetical protein
VVRGSAIRELISRMDLRKTGSDNGRWIEQGQVRVQRRAMTSAVLSLRDLLQNSRLINLKGVRKLGSDDGIWLELAQDRDP